MKGLVDKSQHSFVYFKPLHTSQTLKKGQKKHPRYFFEIPTFYQTYLTMRTIAVTGGKPIAV
jgi:hypothetical protein